MEKDPFADATDENVLKHIFQHYVLHNMTHFYCLCTHLLISNSITLKMSEILLIVRVWQQEATNGGGTANQF